MKKGDRVVLSDHEADASSPFWKRRGIDCNSTGTVLSTLSAGPLPLSGHSVFVEVAWDNGSGSVCNSIDLRPYESKSISLPNKMFLRLKNENI